MPYRICIARSKDNAVAGPSSFVRRLSRAWEQDGITVTRDPESRPLDAVLVISASRRLGALRRCRRKGIRVVQRLDGINWIHRVRRTGLATRVRAELLNLMMRTTRAHLATSIVYQSEFSQRWWNGWYGEIDVPCHIIHNGVDLSEYSPDGITQEDHAGIRIVMMEANIRAGYEIGLYSALELRDTLERHAGVSVQLSVVGRVDDEVRGGLLREGEGLRWLGVQPSQNVPRHLREADVFFSADINAACSNAVIEALATGLPVVGYDTGALAELLGLAGGATVPYGANPWKLEPPKHAGQLAQAVLKVLATGSAARAAARQHAEENFDIREVARRYAEALLA